MPTIDPQTLTQPPPAGTLPPPPPPWQQARPPPGVPTSALVAPIAPSIGDKLTSIAMLGVANGPVAMAPQLQQLAGVAQPVDAGGIVVTIIAGFVGSVIQQVKQYDWFPQNKLWFWLALSLALGICFALWHEDLQKWVLNAMGTVTSVSQNYGPLNKLGIWGPGTDGARKE